MLATKKALSVQTTWKFKNTGIVPFEVDSSEIFKDVDTYRLPATSDISDRSNASSTKLERYSQAEYQRYKNNQQSQ